MSGVGMMWSEKPPIWVDMGEVCLSRWPDISFLVPGHCVLWKISCIVDGIFGYGWRLS